MFETILYAVLPAIIAILSGWYVYEALFGGLCGNTTENARIRPRKPGAFVLFLTLTALMTLAWNNILFLLGAPYSLWNFSVQGGLSAQANTQQFLLIVLPRILDIIWLLAAIALVYWRRTALREWLAGRGCHLSGWCWWVLLGVPVSLLQALFSQGNMLARMIIDIVHWDVSTTFMTIVAWQVAANLLVAGILVALYWWLFREGADATPNDEI